MKEIISKSEINKYLEDIINKVVPEVSPEKIYLFGSYANNNYDRESDLVLKWRFLI